ncbi:lipocalin family protein [Chryseolinea lacunae]|uniref:Extracellular endo-alpha-(1->5)-L-arabinanase C-terminal domain-containing protein n=1 Tax=Chryseolinea lacunae TaxID=2801331 RepID=A0ABS1KMY0_9BACT|nr:lipocalin family protein [Chryseolinea lacunae]MBL0740690.1 hypothetical protein [Chryseolinea lacunae]
MKLLIASLLFLGAVSVNAQTSKELIGKWKLVKETKDGVDKEIKDDTYQVFFDDGKFEGIVGSKTSNGKWKLSDDNKVLTVKISIIKVKFTIEYFDAKRRVINNDMTGRLEYEKAAD